MKFANSKPLIVEMLSEVHVQSLKPQGACENRATQCNTTQTILISFLFIATAADHIKVRRARHASANNTI
jgi:hypothetical protein